MELIKLHAKSADIRLSFGELVIVNNALNEVCNALDQFEFDTRMGAEHREVEALLKQINAVIGRMQGNL